MASTQIRLTDGEIGTFCYWDWGVEQATQLLADIDTVARREAPFKIETKHYMIYWAGSILRVDIKRELFDAH